MTSNGQWKKANNGLYGGSVLSLAVSGTNIFTVVETIGVYLSTDNGNSWILKKNGMTSTDILSLAVAGSTVFASTRDAGVFVSTDNGNSWTHK